MATQDVAKLLAAHFPKTCGTCGTVHTEASFAGLKQLGEQDCQGVKLGLANCFCSSTLAVPVEVTDFEVYLELFGERRAA